MFVITAPVCRQDLESICNLILNKKLYSVIPAYAGIRLTNNIQRDVIPTACAELVSVRQESKLKNIILAFHYILNTKLVAITVIPAACAELVSVRQESV